MELSYWRSRWNKGNVGFHMPGGYPGLSKYWHSLPIPQPPTVLVPLCGKSEDLDFLTHNASQVTGVEISETAVRSYFDERGIVPEESCSHGFSILSHENLQIWIGDFFRFPETTGKKFDLIYDKAALIALPDAARTRYAKKIEALIAEHPKPHGLLHHFEYNQEEMNGPPFSVPLTEIDSLFGSLFTITILEEVEPEPGKYEKFRRRGLISTLKERFLFLHPKC
ncbi:hypothetical protein [Rhodohalobacter mucosus]|uniref:thiopurine S-methyltransferase n=1 Tax=Rhodohalobacter mucosus TaxID=2079485 RepID=A0A316TQQ5_9BACT|nr:hypothetical protein [Rhodohalobacter mucosus]PWN05579.1 hypothetical protein DDZ15_13325 [Rhodohalobacter mucosus]